MSTPEEFRIEDLPRLIESLSPSSLAAHLDRDRPYDGQPHTDTGERGRTLVEGLTYRDVRDCFIRACYESSGLEISEWPGSVHNLPWHEMDIIAVAQNLSVQMEKYQGIYPNVPRLLPVDPTEPHWCGTTLERSVCRAHDGTCDDPSGISEVRP